MKKKNGFTLVELLAVIVILSVLVLLAVPSVLKMLDNARKDTFELEAERIIEAAKLAYSNDIIENGDNKDCYSLAELKEYLEKSFHEDAKASVSITIEDGKSAEYRIWFYNGKYSVAGGTPGNIEATTPSGTVGSVFNTCGVGA